MSRVLICVITFRRVEQLLRLLEKLDSQKRDHVTFSVLVVDNDPEGSASRTCSESAKTLSFDVAYVCEPEPGIVAARNRCVAEFLASGADSLAFIDDDEWPAESSWIESMVSTMHQSGADIVAGDVLSVQGEGTPLWATQILYEKSSRAEGSEMAVFYTGNVLISRHVLAQLTPVFDSRFALTGASDYHFALRSARAGFIAVFSRAPVMEEFPAERATVAWFLRRGFRSGAGYTRSHLIEDRFLTATFRCLGLSALRFLRGLLVLGRGMVFLDKATSVNGLFRVAAAVGTLAGLVGLNYAEYRKLHS